MLRDSKKTLFAALAVLATVSLPTEARADSYGYVCTVTYHPSSAYGYGDHGSVQALYYSEPQCGGSYLGSRRYCSENATSTSCPWWVYQYGEEALAALYQNLVRAAETAQRVYERQYYCQTSSGGFGGGYDCGRTVTFNAD